MYLLCIVVLTNYGGQKAASFTTSTSNVVLSVTVSLKPNEANIRDCGISVHVVFKYQSRSLLQKGVGRAE